MGTFMNSQAGAVWKKMSSAGKAYYQGEVAGKKVLMFKNETKNPKGPSFTFKFEDEADYMESSYDVR